MLILCDTLLMGHLLSFGLKCNNEKIKNKNKILYQEYIAIY